MIRTLWVGLNIFIATVPLASMSVIGGLFGVRGEFHTWVCRTWGRWILWASGVTVRVEGIENVVLDEAQVVVSNHVSWFDVFALAAYLPKRYRFVAKIELARIPLFGRGWIAAGHISIDRGDHAAALQSMDRAGEAIRSDNSSVVIFPEGTRSDSGKLLPFKKGGFIIALRTGVDIVPCAVVGTRAILPKGAWRVKSGQITIRFGRPISTVGLSEVHRGELMQSVRDEIVAMLEPRAFNPVIHVDNH